MTIPTQRVLEALRAGKVPEALITHRMTLSDLPSRFADLTNPKAGVIKGMVEVA